MGKRRRRANGEGSVYRRKSDGQWVAYFTDGRDDRGRPKKFEFYGKSAADARKKRDDAKRRLEQGMPPKLEQVTVGVFLDRWLADVVEPELAAKTYTTYEGLVRIHIKPSLGRIELQKLSPLEVQRLISRKRDEPGLGARTVKHLRDCLRAALNVAVKWRLIMHNPAAHVTPPTIRKRKTTVYDAQQAKQFLASIEGHRLEALFVVALCTGFREGEVLGLGWDDLDEEKKTLRVRHALQRVPVNRLAPRGQRSKLLLLETKTEGSDAVVQIPDLVLKALAKHYERQKQERTLAGNKWQESGRIFTTGIGTFLDARTLLREYDKLRDQCSLPRIRFHDLRHSAATILHVAGVPTQAITKLLRHASSRTTEEIYMHSTPGADRMAAEKMDELLSPVAVSVAVKATKWKPN